MTDSLYEKVVGLDVLLEKNGGQIISTINRAFKNERQKETTVLICENWLLQNNGRDFSDPGRLTFGVEFGCQGAIQLLLESLISGTAWRIINPQVCNFSLSTESNGQSHESKRNRPSQGASSECFLEACIQVSIFSWLCARAVKLLCVIVRRWESQSENSMTICKWQK